MAKKHIPTLSERKKALLRELRKLGVTELEVQWSGGGDSGQIDSITAQDEKQDVEVDLTKHSATWDTVQYGCQSTDVAKKQTGTIEDMVDDFVSGWWQETGMEGWQDNDGGQGHGRLDVKAGTFQLVHENNEMVATEAANEVI